jgi:hypothetical protein
MSSYSRLQIATQSYVTTDGQSASQSWCQAPSGAQDQILITVRQLRVCRCGAPSLMRTGLSFKISAGPRQRSHFWVRVPQDSYFAVSDSWLPQPGGSGLRIYIPPGWPSYTLRHWVPFSSPPATLRATVEVFEPASTRGNSQLSGCST